jgi:hypothetical protein
MYFIYAMKSMTIDRTSAWTEIAATAVVVVVALVVLVVAVVVLAVVIIKM